jgi:DNA polymerase III subunit epsilon
MIAIVWDVESTGFPIRDRPSESDGQPHLVQVAAMLMNLDDGAELDRMDVIVRPDGWEIPADSVATHGITTARALAEGISEADALYRLMGLYDGADQSVAFNIPFDLRLTRTAMLRGGLDKALCDEWKASVPTFCVMQASRKLTQLPKNKAPTLSEAVEIILGEKLEGAHNALNDVRATARLYFHINGLPAPKFKEDAA